MRDPETGQLYDRFGEPINEQGEYVDGPSLADSSGDTASQDAQQSREAEQHGLGVETSAERQQRQDAEQQAQDERARRVRNARLAEMSTSRNRREYLNGQLVQTYTVYLDEDGNQVDKNDPGAIATTIRMVGGQPVGENADAAIDGLGPHTTAQQRADYQRRQAQRSATYGLIGGDETTGGLEFIMSNGPVLDQDGNQRFTAPAGSQHGPVIQTNNPTGRPDMNLGRDMATTPATNLMTVEGGVTWFRNLSRSNPDLYNEYVELLVDSGYLAEDKARRSAYTLDAGAAIAGAMVDAAQNHDAGSDDDLRTFLQKMGDQFSAARADAYTPVTRSYIDPEALAQTARQAAEDLIGRAMNDDEVATFQSKFRSLEDGYYDQIDAAGRAGTGARVADPNASGQAEAMIRDDPKYNTERAGQLVGGYMDALKQLLGG